MATIPKSNVANGNTIQATDIKNIIDALDGTTARDIIMTGSLNLTGSIVTGSISNASTASIANTASYWSGSIVNALSSSYSTNSKSSSYSTVASSSGWDGYRFGDCTIVGDYSNLTGITLYITGSTPISILSTGRWEQSISGTLNTLIGINSGQNMDYLPDRRNTTLGARSEEANVTGSHNTAVGYGALIANLTSSNTALGAGAGSTLTTGTNNTCIGSGSNAASATTSNTITLGNSAIATLRCQQTTITSLSDRRDKKDIKPLNLGLEFIEELNPVTFTWDMRDGAKKDIPDLGFIAQDLQELENKYRIKDYTQLVYEENPDKLEATWGRLLPIAIKAIQELSEKVSKLEDEIYYLKNK